MSTERFTIRLYRKEGVSTTKKPTKAILAKADHALALSRVRRPDLESFIRSGGFHRLPALPSSIVKNPALRRRDHLTDCYILTDGDLGRSKASGETGAMSVRIWLTRYYADTGVIGTDEFAIVVDEDDDE